MRLLLMADERATLKAAQARRLKARHWRRYRAVLLRTAGPPVAVVAPTLGCSEASGSSRPACSV